MLLLPRTFIHNVNTNLFAKQKHKLQQKLQHLKQNKPKTSSNLFHLGEIGAWENQSAYTIHNAIRNYRYLPLLLILIGNFHLTGMDTTAEAAENETLHNKDTKVVQMNDRTTKHTFRRIQVRDFLDISNLNTSSSLFVFALEMTKALEMINYDIYPRQQVLHTHWR